MSSINNRSSMTKFIKQEFGDQMDYDWIVEQDRDKHVILYAAKNNKLVQVRLAWGFWNVSKDNVRAKLREVQEELGIDVPQTKTQKAISDGDDDIINLV